MENQDGASAANRSLRMEGLYVIQTEHVFEVERLLLFHEGNLCGVPKAMQLRIISHCKWNDPLLGAVLRGFDDVDKDGCHYVLSNELVYVE